MSIRAFFIGTLNIKDEESNLLCQKHLPVNLLSGSLKGKYVWKYFTYKKGMYGNIGGCQYYGEDKFSAKESSLFDFHLVKCNVTYVMYLPV